MWRFTGWGGGESLLNEVICNAYYAYHAPTNMIVGSVRFRDIAAFVCCQGPFLPSFISKGYYQVFLGTSSAELGEN